MKKINDFDAIAYFYDSLARLVFGSSIKKAQLHFISSISAKSKILIIGGGTGWILPEILKAQPESKITYIDLSARMIEQAKKQILPTQKKSVEFIQIDICQYLQKKIDTIGLEPQENPPQVFDVVITNFFLDIFNEDNLPKIMQEIKSVLKENGVWICTDFYQSGERGINFYQQKFLIKIMYKFFKLVTNLEGKKLLNFDAHFELLKMYSVNEAYFYHKMIKISLFKIL